jgi:condensin complex subunit 1
MSKMLDALLSAFGAQIDAAIRDSKEEDQQIVMAHKLPLEMYAFLVNWFVGAAEKVKAMGEEDAPPAPVKARRGRGGKAGSSRAAAAKKAEQWTWTDQIPGTLELICKALKLKTHRIWVTSPERDAFITCVRFALYLMVWRGIQYLDIY